MAQLKEGDLVPGTKYRVVRALGAGGMGVVYLVEKGPLRGVLKLMSPELAKHKEFRDRFADEVRVLARLEHPNIVRIFDHELESETPCFVMEVLTGRTLRDVLATGVKIRPRIAFEITRQLLEALHCAHTYEVTVVHRDIKPENIFLHSPKHGDPIVKLIDFGVVALSDRKHDGTFVGTWSYAAPEQIRGEQATPATDLYAVGLVLFEMLAGVGPFDQYETGALISQAQLSEIPPPVSKYAPWTPESIVRLVASALAKDPRERPIDAYAFSEQLYELENANDGAGEAVRGGAAAIRHALSTVQGSDPLMGAKILGDGGARSSKDVGGADTFASQESDTQLPPRKTSSRTILAIVLAISVLLPTSVAVATWARREKSVTTAPPTPPPLVTTQEAPPALTDTSLPKTVEPTPTPAPPASTSAPRPRGAGPRVKVTPAPATSPGAAPPAPTKPRDDFIRGI